MFHHACKLGLEGIVSKRKDSRYPRRIPPGSRGRVAGRSLLKDDAFFAPDDIATLVAAFDSALDALKLAHREDQATLLVAKSIIEEAKQGERDPNRLREAAIRMLRK